MNRLEEIKNEVALRYEFENWFDLRSFHILEDVPGLEEYEDEVVQKYATECCKASLEKASENSDLLVTDFLGNNKIKTLKTFFDKSLIGDTERKVEVNKEAIKNESNIILL